MRRFALCITILVVLFAITIPVTAQTITEDNLLGLINKNKAPEPVVVKIIGMAKRIEIDTSIENMARLMGQGVSEQVMNALIARKTQLNPSAAPVPSTNLTASTRQPMLATIGDGVFAQTQKGLVPLPQEVINQKGPSVFGAMASYTSMGLKKTELKGSLKGTRSSIQLPRPVTLTFRGDYELIPLESEKGKREFVSLTMGLRSSNELETLPLKTEMAENGAKKAVLDLPDGEYGLIPVGTGRSTMYTFGVSGGGEITISSLR